MKTTLLLVFFAFSFNFAKSQTASVAPYDAQSIGAIGSKTLWIYGNGKNGEGLYQRLNTWNYYTSGKHTVKDFDASSSGVILLNSTGQIHQFDKNVKKWTQQTGMTNVKAICDPNDGKAGVMAIGTVGQSNGTSITGLFRSSTQNTWSLISSDAICSTVIKLDAAQGTPSYPYVLTNTGKVFQLIANNWQEVSTGGVLAKDLAIGQNNNLYIADANGSWYRYESGQFNSIQFNATIASIDMNGNIYGVVNSKVEAIEDGVKKTITGNNVDAYDANGNTALTAAALLSDENSMQSKLAEGADPNVPNRNGDYPLTIAAENNNLEMVSMLMDVNANPDVVDQDGHCALFYAVEKGNTKIAQALLIANGSPACDAVVETAVKNGNKEMLLVLSTYNADFTPGFEYAVASGNTTTFKTLLRYSDGLKDNGPFNKSVDLNNVAMAEMCLQNGANASEGLTYSLSKRNSSMIALCLQNGAKTDGAVQYAVDNTDATLANDLIDRYRVMPSDLLAKSLNYVPKNGTGTNQLSENNDNSQQDNTGQQSGSDHQQTETSNNTNAPKGPHVNLVNPNLKIAEIALSKGADPNPYVQPALDDNNENVLKLLLKYNADPNVVLKAAVSNNKLELAKEAVNNGATITDPQLMRSAVDSNRTEMANLLLDAGADATDPMLMKSAVNNSNTALVSTLLTKGASATDTTLVAVAASKNNIDMVGMLVQYGANPTYGLKPAIQNNNTELAIFLLDKGASPYESSLLSTAVEKGNKTITTSLVEKGANVDNGMLSAVKFNRLELFNYLIDKGANALKTDLVYMAVAKNHIKIFNRLMDLSAPVDYNGSNNENLLHVACRNQSYPIAQKLIEKGVSVNQKTTTGDTPLHIAADVGRNNIDLCKLLVENGADVNATNNRGKSIYRVADGKKLKKYLKSKGARK